METRKNFWPQVAAIAATLVATTTTHPLTWAADPQWGGQGKTAYVMLANSEERALQSTGADSDYWTPERMQQAQDLTMLPATTFAEQAELDELTMALLNEDEGEPVIAEGQPPQVKVRPDRTHRLYEPLELLTPAPQLDALTPEPQNAGTLNAHFTSSRLIPLSADTSYPYRTVGKLFFTIPGQGDFVCSASVIKPRLILTAGHCVHSGTASPGFFTNWRFVPAFRDGAAPFQSWDWSFVITTSTWASGGGGVPNAADYALIELRDRTVNNAVRRIGEVTGFLGFQTLSLLPNHAHILGYPGNLDSGQKMHQVTAESFRAVAPNCVEYGSDMRGGSSGGPYVQNFGALATGQTGGTNTGLNRVIGVVSYGYTSTDPKVQGSSILDSRFTTILNTACGRQAGNC
ncbi:MAG: trypsin-like serine protease [Thermodesulfobacteriota bacterium]|jgi:V8-like Glu-specific endopeptidase